PEREVGVVLAVFHDAVLVGRPLPLDLPTVDVQLRVAEQGPRDELERFLLGFQVASNRPPGARPSLAGPNALARSRAVRVRWPPPVRRARGSRSPRCCSP